MKTVFSVIIFLMLAASSRLCFCQEKTVLSQSEAAELLAKADTVWKREGKGLKEITEVIDSCERLLEGRDTLQTTEEGKIIIGKTYYLIGQAYAAKNELASSSDSSGPRTGTVKKLKLDNGIEIDMIYCEPGDFIMGSPFDEEGRDSDETPHRVILTKGFWLGKYEVTQAQWEAIMNKNPSKFKNSRTLPVDSISWNDCREFVRRLNAKLDCGARMPTEAEWEYACRAGTKTAFFWGNSLNGRRANCNGDFPCATRERGPYLHRPTPAGHYAPNPWGFFDMHGNMYEWCLDKCGDYPDHEVKDPVCDSYGKCRVLRGGCWYFGARFCRSANRIKNNPSYADAFTGFRLCCDKIP